MLFLSFVGEKVEQWIEVRVENSITRYKIPKWCTEKKWTHEKKIALEHKEKKKTSERRASNLADCFFGVYFHFMRL